MPWKRMLVVAVVLVVSCGCIGLYKLVAVVMNDPIAPTYEENCATCHGNDLEGAALGTPLVGRDLHHGETVTELTTSISQGFEIRGMPAFANTLRPEQIQGLAILIAERRANFSRTDFKVDAPLEIRVGRISTEEQAFRIETVADDLHPWPFSIAPLPDGRLLLTEKTRGLSIIEADGSQGPLIEGTPPAHDDGFEILSLVYGTGWLFDVALHPDYEQNGWVYLHFGDRCQECETSMNKVIRGRIRDGRWQDEEVIWQAAPETYTQTPDLGAGGRLAFDGAGHLFLSIGIKGPSNYHGVQDLSQPVGKVHRVHDDGRIPEDNPFIDTDGALPSIWTYGHRSPQGLEFDRETGLLWSTEMGPRGGDEINLLQPGRNYGWPLYSKGVNYDGTPVAYGTHLGIQLDLEAIEQPVVDLTPSPAVASFVIYGGDAFPEWRGDLIVGSLKARELYRFELDGDRVVHREKLLTELARIRDIEVGPGGAIYLLLEHGAGSKIVRLAPAG